MGKLGPYEENSIVVGDCLSALRDIPDECFTAVLCDPPYGLSKNPDMTEVLRCWMNDEEYRGASGGFMNKEWDSFVPGPAVWKEIYRVMKPGAVLLAFGGTRTADLLGLALRLAGFEIADTVMWLYGSG